MDKDLIQNILSRFYIEDGELSFRPITHGYINNTFLVYLNTIPKYVLQQVNQKVFKNVEHIQENIQNVLSALKGTNYTEIEFVNSDQNKSFVIQNGQYWRLMNYIDKSQVYDTTQDPEIALEAGKIIGKFHVLVQNENLDNYHEIIPDFHSIRLREEQFNTALNSATKPLINKAQDQIEYALSIIEEFEPFYQRNLPIRLCHNDTKLNNILFDSDKKALCLIDLDTIMKGYFHYDFGDAVRTIVNHANEDENDISKVTFDVNLFKRFVQGISASQLRLTPQEIDLLPLSAALMPFLHGIRALTDHLNGNIYYKVTYPNQNIDRCKALFQFTKLALNNKLDMKNCVAALK